MGIYEFRGPGLSDAQWGQIKTLADSLDDKQLLWLSGFFAGVEFRAGNVEGSTPLGLSVPPLAPSVPERTLSVLYGSETGNSAELATSLAAQFNAQGRPARLLSMATYKTRELKNEQDLLIITSTHGEGAPPASALSFFEFVEGRKAPRLDGVRFAVLALGDSTYESFCGAGKRLDARFAELGAIRIRDRVDCDVDYETPAADWASAMLAKLGSTGLQPARMAAVHATPAAPAAAAFDKRNPFSAVVAENIVLTGRGSSKETRHVELSLDGSGLSFQPGDALGIVPRNDPAVVESLLETLQLDPAAKTSVKDRSLSLADALGEAYEITAATPRFIDHWAELTGAAELQSLRGESAAKPRTEFLHGNHIIDIVRRFPVKGIDPKSFLAGLRPLQPRLYSIASSFNFAPDEAHLTISTVRYALNGTRRSGVTSGQIAHRADVGAVLPVYIQANPQFRLPDNDTPIIMIGAGTGVAPYRSFLQEREVAGATGKSWMFFGERNFDSDFLYQSEWQAFLKDGVLSHMNVAFSRDGADKVYVQHRLLEHARDVYAWLEEGAHIYVCGDGAKLAPDVHAALLKIVEQQSGKGKAAAEDYISAMQSDRRYQMDVY